MRWKYIPPIMLILVPWLIILPFLCSFAQLQILSQWLFEYSTMPVYAAFPVTLALNILCAYFYKWNTEELTRWNLRVKLLLIPVHLFVVFFAIGVPWAIPFLFLFDAALMLVSSGYGIRAIFRAMKEETIGKTGFWILLIWHCFFVTDVIAAVVLNRKLKT